MKIAYIIVLVVLVLGGGFNFDAATKRLSDIGCLWHGLMSGICFGLAMAVLALLLREYLCKL